MGKSLTIYKAVEAAEEEEEGGHPLGEVRAAELVHSALPHLCPFSQFHYWTNKPSVMDYSSMSPLEELDEASERRLG